MQGIPALKDGSLRLASVIPAWGDLFLYFLLVLNLLKCIEFGKRSLNFSPTSQLWLETLVIYRENLEISFRKSFQYLLLTYNLSFRGLKNILQVSIKKMNSNEWEQIPVPTRQISSFFLKHNCVFCLHLFCCIADLTVNSYYMQREGYSCS